MTNFHRYGIAAAMLLVPMAAIGAGMLQTNPIPGIDVVVKKKPAGSAIRVMTDDKGGFVLKGIEPGSYEVTLDAASLRRGVIKVDRDRKTRDRVRLEWTPLVPRPPQTGIRVGGPFDYDGDGVARALTFTVDLPAPCTVGRDKGCTGKADYRGTVTLVSVETARSLEANTAMGEVSTTR